MNRLIKLHLREMYRQARSEQFGWEISEASKSREEDERFKAARDHDFEQFDDLLERISEQSVTDES